MEDSNSLFFNDIFNLFVSWRLGGRQGAETYEFGPISRPGGMLLSV